MVNALLRPLVCVALQLPVQSASEGEVFLTLDRTEALARAFMTPVVELPEGGSTFIVAFSDEPDEAELLPARDPGPEAFMDTSSVDDPHATFMLAPN